MNWEWNLIFDKVHIGMPDKCKEEVIRDDYRVIRCEGTSINVFCVLADTGIISENNNGPQQRINIKRSYKRTQNGVEQYFTEMSYEKDGESLDAIAFSCPVDDKQISLTFEWNSNLRVDGIRVGRMLDSIFVK